MNTPNLDKLMEQATHGPRTSRTRLDSEAKLSLLFEEHGPAMVAALKWYTDEHSGCSCYAATDYICRACTVRSLLTTLDQEAKG